MHEIPSLIMGPIDLTDHGMKNAADCSDDDAAEQFGRDTTSSIIHGLLRVSIVLSCTMTKFN